MNQKTLETERLILRRFREEDLADFYEYASRLEVGPAAGWKPHDNPEESRAILAGFIEGEEVWAIVWKEMGKVIGSVGLHADGRRSASPEIKMLGYVLSPDYWGRGIMTEAARRMVSCAFEEMGAELLTIQHFSFNSRSKRVIEKCGFTYEGRLRRCFLRYGGEWLDECCYSMTRDEYFLEGAEKFC
ncbi:MAG TPA: GNAT family N-acetyltransferase [Candidatus Merdivicinus faecavium]|nr:GNAT family N-acetyltransferase [Candidatus Merdivicinus faecavium]